MTIPALPNLSPNGVIQNPGIGQILGQGIGNLAQFLQAKQQMEQQRQLAQQQLGQGQQRIDLEKAQQEFQRNQITQAQQQEQAKQTEQQRQGLAVGDALQRMQPYQLPGMDMSPTGQIGGPSVQGYQAPSTSVTPSTGDVLQGMQPQDASAMLASSGYKSIIEQRQKDEEAKQKGTEVIDINGTPVFKYGGATAGANIPKGNEVSADLGDALFFLGQRRDTDPKSLSPAVREQAYRMAESLASLKSPKPDFSQMMAAAAVPKLVELASGWNTEAVAAKDDLYNVNRALQFSQNMTSGPGANTIIALQSWLAKVGIGDATSASNAQDFLQATASRIIPLPKGLSRLTDKELEWLKSMKGANITNNPANIQRILNDARIYDEDVIADRNRKINASPLDERLKQGYTVDPNFAESYKDAFGAVKPSAIGGGP